MMCCVSHNLCFAHFRYAGAARCRFVPKCANRELCNLQFAHFAQIYPLYTHTKGQELVGILPTHTGCVRQLLGGLGSAEVPQ